MDISIGDVKGLQLLKLNEETTEFRQTLHAILKSKGFERTFAGNRSAMYDWTYTRGKEVVAISGWHGTGKKGTNRHWGDARTVMVLYHGLTLGRADKMIIRIDNFTGSTFDKDDNEIPDTRSMIDLLKGHTEGVAKMLAFVRNLK